MVAAAAQGTPLIRREKPMIIRSYRAEDWDLVWAILEPVFRAGDKYAIRTDIMAGEAREYWTSIPKQVFVAIDEQTGQLLGTYYVRPNFDGPGSHVCNCGYIVAEDARGRGVASRMCEHSQAEAAARGFRAMQYNLVVSTNERAVRLWKHMGFEIIGTVPGGFRHPRLGFVDAYIMYKVLAASVENPPLTRSSA
jgi:ribosomal protein S18 acetylase RimI-like enzyme